MKTIKLVVIFIFLLTINLFAHKEWVHQYTVKQAYYFLENQIGGEIVDFKNHIGLDYYGKGDDSDPWSTGYIGVGAWREDLEDIIWGYGGIGNNWDPSITHFWKGDDGDNCPGIYENVENAYYKARLMLFGGHNFLFAKTAIDPNYGTILGRFYSYNSLTQFFQTGICYDEGYVSLDGTIHHLSPVQVNMEITSARKTAYQILGRVAHLLADMGVPAHVHNDAHPCQLGDSDEYEMWMGVIRVIFR
jgi:hypothetical protein